MEGRKQFWAEEVLRKRAQDVILCLKEEVSQKKEARWAQMAAEYR